MSLFREEKPIHANYCLVQFNGQTVGALQDIIIEYKTTDVFYNYLGGGTEIHKGTPTIEGKFRMGVVDLGLMEKTIGSKIIDLRETMMILPTRFDIIIDMKNINHLIDEQMKQYYIIISYATLNNYGITLTDGNFVIQEGSFMAEGLRIVAK